MQSVTVVTDLFRNTRHLNNLEQIFFRNAELVMSTTLAHEIIEFIRKLILSGGSPINRWSWGYWEHKLNGWGYVKGRKGKGFAGKWSGLIGVKYPIHPRSYFKRKVRRKPAPNQLALYDTGELYNSFRVVYSYHDHNDATIAIGSTTKKLDYHEEGTSSPKRVILAPTKHWLDKNQPLLEKTITNVLLKTESELTRI